MAGEIGRTLRLSDGSSMPRVGLGCFVGEYICTEELAAAALQAVKTAIDAGYRHFDTAALYDTEVPMGRAIQAKIEDGIIRREDVYITTKLGCNNLQPERVEPALRQSLKNLDMDYVDLYLIHGPVAFKGGDEWAPVDSSGKIIYDTELDLMDTWKAMEACQKKGLTKSIGVSNFPTSELQRVLDICEVRPVVHQVECHPFHTQEKMVDFCLENNVVVQCFAVLGGPPICPQFPGLPIHDRTDKPDIIGNKTLETIGKKYNKSTAQVALRFQLQRGLVVLAKSFNPERQRQNLDVFDFTLSEEEMGTIMEMNRNYIYYE